MHLCEARDNAERSPCIRGVTSSTLSNPSICHDTLQSHQLCCLVSWSKAFSSLLDGNHRWKELRNRQPLGQTNFHKGHSDDMQKERDESLSPPVSLQQYSDHTFHWSLQGLVKSRKLHQNMPESFIPQPLVAKCCCRGLWRSCLFRLVKRLPTELSWRPLGNSLSVHKIKEVHFDYVLVLLRINTLLAGTKNGPPQRTVHLTKGSEIKVAVHEGVYQKVAIKLAL